MDRLARGALLAAALLVLLAGCAAPITDVTGPSDDGPNGNASAGDGPGAGETPDAGTNDADGGGEDPAALGPSIDAPGPAPAAGDGDGAPASQQPDPDGDLLGWEDGYWYNDPVPAAAGETLNDTELDAVISRAMARVEYVRGLEFEESVNVSVTSRAEFGTDQLGRSNTSEALRTFDNAKFHALFMIGGDSDSLDTQDETLNTSVGGYYSTERDAIVIVADGDEPTLTSERTLSHELVHALQDQHFTNVAAPPRLRDAYNGRNGLYEGDANAVQYAYLDRCENDQWRCLDAGEDGPAGGSAGDLHWGVYFLEYFPYSDGPGLIAHLGADRGWSGVDAAYDRIPTSATEAIYPDRYGSFEPREVELSDDLRGGWERVRPANRPDYGRLGQSALVATFAYTAFDDYEPQSAVVSVRDVVNAGIVSVDTRDPLNYDLPATRGWVGDRLHVYERDGDVAYVWRLAWESPGEAEEFAERYRALLSHWGGERVGESTWQIGADSPFTGAVYLDVDGDRVTIARAPTESGLGDVYEGAR